MYWAAKILTLLNAPGKHIKKTLNGWSSHAFLFQLISFYIIWNYYIVLQNGIAQPGNLHLECLDSIETSSKYQGESHQQDMLSRTEVKDARDSQSNRTTALLPHVHIYESVVKYLDDHTKHLKTISNILEEKKAEDEINGEWKELAETMDKLFLVVYLILSIIVFLYYFLKTIE